MYDASVAIDFSPLSKIGDSFVAARESARDRALWAQYQAPDDAAPAGPQVAAAGGAAPPPAPGRPLSMGQTMANGPTRMAMPPEAFAPLIKQAAAQYGLDEGMFTRQLAQESAFAPDVIDGTRRSSAGAMGIAQFMPGTAKRFGINPLDPAQAIPAAAQYVAENRKLLGNDGFAYAGYNWGEGNVQKWLANGADPRAVPGETRDYVQKITGRPIEAWASARGGQGAPQAAQAPQGGATAAPATQAAQMPAASAAQPGAAPAPAQNSAKRAALIQLLSSSNPATRETARYLLTEMQKDNNWSVVDLGPRGKAMFNARTSQLVPLADTAKPERDQIQIVKQNGQHYTVDRNTGAATPVAGLPPDAPGQDAKYHYFQQGGRQFRVNQADPKAQAEEVAVPAGPQQPDTSTLTGDQLLATLPPADAALVKKLASYEVDPRTLSIVGGHREKMVGLASQYDGDYDQTKYGARVKARNDMATGKLGTNATAIATAIGHLGSLAENAEKLPVQTQFPRINALGNAVAKEIGNPDVTNFAQNRSAVGDELMRVFRQVGASDHESREWKSHYDAAMSPQQLQGAIRMGVDLLQSRIDGLVGQYNAAMGTDYTPQEVIFSKQPHARQVLERISGEKIQARDIGSAAPKALPEGWSPERMVERARQLVRDDPSQADAAQRRLKEYGIKATVK